jgi:hypothetical protein
MLLISEAETEGELGSKEQFHLVCHDLDTYIEA